MTKEERGGYWISFNGRQIDDFSPKYYAEAVRKMKRKKLDTSSRDNVKAFLRDELIARERNSLKVGR